MRKGAVGREDGGWFQPQPFQVQRSRARIGAYLPRRWRDKSSYVDGCAGDGGSSSDNAAPEREGPALR